MTQPHGAYLLQADSLWTASADKPHWAIPHPLMRLAILQPLRCTHMSDHHNAPPLYIVMHADRVLRYTISSYAGTCLHCGGRGVAGQVSKVDGGAAAHVVQKLQVHLLEKVLQACAASMKSQVTGNQAQAACLPCWSDWLFWRGARSCNEHTVSTICFWRTMGRNVWDNVWHRV